MATQTCPCTCGINGLEQRPWENQADGSFILHFTAPAGLYQLSIVAEARDFNWDELYITLNLFHNTGQRTGPWDFNLLDQNKPLVPSYWVTLNGQRLGLWYFQRVSLEDIAGRRFRGNTAFHLATAGAQELILTPYRPFTVSWLSAVLEADPEDRLETVTADLEKWPERRPAAAWSRPEYWERQRQALATTHAKYREPLQHALAWLRQKPAAGAGDLPLLLAAYYLDGTPAMLEQALAVIDKTIALPHWGNPKEDGYGHNGDMGAAESLRTMAWAYFALAENQLGQERRERLLAKLALQGDRFFANTLLTRDYWGGSVVQDHGWKSLFGFGAAALHLVGALPQAATWAAFVLPRLRRSVAAIPQDGAIPPSSYQATFLFLNEPTFYRDTLLAFNGTDIFDHPPFRLIQEYLFSVVRKADHNMLVANPFGHPVIAFYGANAFFNRIAAKFKDRRAATIQQTMLETPPAVFTHGVQEQAFNHDVLWGFLSYEPAVKPLRKFPVKPPLTLFDDSGLAHYHDQKTDLTLSLRCGPFTSYTGYRRAQGSCDRLAGPPGAGHFILARGSQPLLNTPDSGYSLHTHTRSCLLVDGKGQWGDIGYPMSLPGFRHRWECIREAHWDAAAGTGFIRLDLAPAYPEELEMAAYTRDFRISAGQPIVCRDTVVFNRPHRLSWLFHTLGAEEITLIEGLRCRFGGAAGVQLDPRPVGVTLEAGIQKTDIVYAYSSASQFKPFYHVRYDTREQVSAVTLDFIISVC